MKKKLMLLLSLAVIISLLFTACGEKTQEENKEETVKVEDQAIKEDDKEVEEENNLEESIDLDYENMTAEDLVKDIKDINKITVDEYLRLIESYKYVEIDEYFAWNDNITSEAFRLLNDQGAGFPEPKEVLAKGLLSPVPVVRGESLVFMRDSLGMDDEAIKTALELTKEEEDPYVLYKLTHVLKDKMQKPEVAELVFKMSEHEDPAVRYKAAEAMGNTSSRDVAGTVERLVEMMEDEDDKVRDIVYRNSGFLLDDRIVDPMVKVLMDPEQAEFHGSCMHSLTALWLDFPGHNNTSEKAYKAAINYLKYTPRSANIPEFTAVSPMRQVEKESDTFLAWKEKATYYNPDELVECMVNIIKDPQASWVTGSTAVEVVKNHGTQEQFNNLKAVIESLENENKTQILDSYNKLLTD